MNTIKIKKYASIFLFAMLMVHPVNAQEEVIETIDEIDLMNDVVEEDSLENNEVDLVELIDTKDELHDQSEFDEPLLRTQRAMNGSYMNKEIQIISACECDQAKVVVTSDLEQKEFFLKDGQTTNFEINATDHFLSFEDQTGQVYRIYNDYIRARVNLRFDENGNFKLEYPKASLYSNYILYDQYKTPVSNFVGKDGSSEVVLYDENYNVVADRIIHPEGELEQSMIGYFGLNDNENKVQVFDDGIYQFEYLQKTHKVHWASVKLLVSNLKMVGDKQSIDMSVNNLIELKLLPQIEKEITVYDHEGNVRPYQTINFYHDENCEKPMLHENGEPMSFQTDENGKFLMRGIYQGECVPVLQLNGQPEYLNPYEKDSDTIYIFSLDKTVYVEAADLPDHLALRDDSKSFELISTRPKQVGDMKEKFKDYFPATEEPEELHLVFREIPDVPITGDYYDPMPYVRMFTFSIIAIIYSYVLLKLNLR